MREFRVDQAETSGDMLLKIVGEVDIATVGEVQHALDKALRSPTERIVVDLSGVAFMDASGAALLLRYDALARAFGHSLVVVRGTPCVQRLLELTGVAYRLEIIDQSPARAA